MKKKEYNLINIVYLIALDKASTFFCYLAAHYVLSKTVKLPGMLTNSPRDEMYEQWYSDLYCFGPGYGTARKIFNASSLIHHAIYLNWRYKWWPMLICRAEQ